MFRQTEAEHVIDVSTPCDKNVLKLEKYCYKENQQMKSQNKGRHAQ